LQEAGPYGQIVAVFLVCIFFNYSASSSILVIKTFIKTRIEIHDVGGIYFSAGGQCW
jgi:hypothetical protein